MTIRNYEDFVTQLKNVAKARYNIDIYELKRNLSGDVLKLSGQITNEASQQILIKNLQELYQDYLQNTKSPEVYFNHLVDGYKYLLDMSVLQDCKQRFVTYMNEQTNFTVEQTGLVYTLTYPESIHGIYPKKVIHIQNDLLNLFPYNDISGHEEELDSLIADIATQFEEQIQLQLNRERVSPDIPGESTQLQEEPSEEILGNEDAGMELE